MKNIYIIGFIIVTILSCKNEEVKIPVVSPEGDVAIEVISSAGELWDASDDFLPLPFNVGKAGDKDVLVLSSRISEGKNLDVQLLGAIRVTQNDTLKTYLISIPSSQDMKSIDVDDFDEFSTVYSSAKWIVEQYLQNRKPQNKVKLKSWEGEKFAIKHLLD